MKDLRTAINIDFDSLLKEGTVEKIFTFECLDESLKAYKDMHKYLTLAREVVFGEAGETFAFTLHITVYPPYIITLLIYII